MKLPDYVDVWLRANDLNLYELLSIAFVPLRTYEEVISGSEFLSPKYRLFLVTGLATFKLTLAQQKQYEISRKSGSQIELDEKIAKKFIKDWKKGILPEEDDRLILSANQKRDKKEMSELLRKKFFETKIAAIEPSVNSNEEGIVPPSLIKQVIEEMTLVFKSGEEELAQYLKKNGRDIRSLNGLYNVLLLSSSPSEAYQQLKTYTEKLLN